MTARFRALLPFAAGGGDARGQGEVACPTMKDVMTSLAEYRGDILRIAETYGVGNIRVFGPALLDDAAAGTDLDLLVDMDPARSLFDLVDFGRELGELLGRRVEVLTAASLNPRLRAGILAEARTL